MKRIIICLLLLLSISSNAVFATTETAISIIDCFPQLLPKTHLDVVFVIDSTGSMADEIRQVKTHIQKIMSEITTQYVQADIRVGIVSYRDHPPEDYTYVVDSRDLTRNINSIQNYLNDLEATGGGDFPEAVDDALHQAINSLSWRSNARKIIYLIGDAPPHGVGSEDSSFLQGSPSGYHYKQEIETAKNEDIVIHTISASGMDSIGIDVWQSIASKTGGSYSSLQYERVAVDDYYQREGLPSSYAAEAKADADYDSSTNSIQVNSLSEIVQSSLIKEIPQTGEHSQNESFDKVKTLPLKENWLRRLLGSISLWIPRQ